MAKTCVYGACCGRRILWSVVVPILLAISWRLQWWSVIVYLAHLDWGTVLAACIGVTGYVFDARTSRATEIRALRVQRAQSQVADLLVPINVNFQSLMLSLMSFLNAHVVEAFGHEDSGAFTNPDYVLRKQVPDWTWRASDGIMKFTASSTRCPTGVTYEIPARLAEAIAAEPDGALARAYRHWARHEWVPGVLRIADKITEASHLMETIPSQRLTELYSDPTPMGTSSWNDTPRGFFLSWWLSYALGWQAVLAWWDADDFATIRPNVAFPVGIFRYIVEGQTVVGELQKELTGHSQMHGSHGRNFHTPSKTPEARPA